MIHELKCWPEYFAVIGCGEKNFEVRKKDRDFSPGDVLLLREFIPCPTCSGTGSVTKWHNYSPDGEEQCTRCQGTKGEYTGRSFKVAVRYLMEKHAGIVPGYCVMGIALPREND